MSMTARWIPGTLSSAYSKTRRDRAHYSPVSP
jgi:hypothetical protein